MTTLYHADKYLPPVRFEHSGFTPNYSRHAIEAARCDRYGVIQLPDYIPLDERTIFEIEADGRRIIKVAIRIPYNSDYDLSVVFNPFTYTIITVWLNETNDNHSTLNLSRYASR